MANTKGFAAAGSQRWLQIAVNRRPELLDLALRRAGAIGRRDTVTWRCPLESDAFREGRDGEALRMLGFAKMPKVPLSDFWPKRGPVWDALGISAAGLPILVEAKAHIAEAASPPTKATGQSRGTIERALLRARKHYAPRSKADWTETFYQYANRLAFQYFLAHLNGLNSKVVFLDFCNAQDMDGPETELEWKGATRLIHAQMGLPPDLTAFGVFHAYMDARQLADAL